MIRWRGTSPRSVWVLLGSMIATLFAVAAPPSLAPAVPAAGGYVAVTPARLADTRTGFPVVGGVPSIRLAAGQTLLVPVLGRGGVPAGGVAAVFVNVTAVDPSGPGYLTTWPAGTAQPNASTLNYGDRQTVANGAWVALGAAGRIAVFSEAASDVIVDVQGYVASPSPINVVNPARLVDTRTGTRTIDGRFAGIGPVAGGTAIEFAVTGRAGLPATGIAGVMVNVVAVDPANPGYLTAWSGDGPRPVASTLNYSAGQTIANNAYIGLGTAAHAGMATIYADGTTQLIVDIVGYVPTGSAPTTLAPARLADTRSGAPTVDGFRQGQGPVRPLNVFDLPVVGRGGVPATGVGAVVLNVAVVDPAGVGYVTAWPSGRPRPVASILNYVAGQTIANGTVVAVGDAGRVSVSASTEAQIIVDVIGWVPGNAHALAPIYGIDIAPFIGGPPPLLLTADLVRELTERVAPYTSWIRTYECSGFFGGFASEAHRLGVKIAMGGWISTDAAQNRREIDCLKFQAAAGNADMVIVGSEVQHRGNQTADQMVAFINEVSAATNVPVAVADTSAPLLAHPEVMAAADVVFVSIHPYWTGTSIDGALAELQTRYAAVVAAAGGKPVVISETGWPTCGAVRGAAVPSQENAVRYLGEVTRWAATAKVPYFWLEAYDQAWKANAAEGPVGSCWGLWTENGELKKGFRPLFLAP